MWEGGGPTTNPTSAQSAANAFDCASLTRRIAATVTAAMIVDTLISSKFIFNLLNPVPAVFYRETKRVFLRGNIHHTDIVCQAFSCVLRFVPCLKDFGKNLKNRLWRLRQWLMLRTRRSGGLLRSTESRMSCLRNLPPRTALSARERKSFSRICYIPRASGRLWHSFFPVIPRNYLRRHGPSRSSCLTGWTLTWAVPTAPLKKPAPAPAS